MPIYNGIKAKVGFSRISHNDFVIFLRRVYRNLYDNPSFPRPPIDLAVFLDIIERYSAAITASLDGSKTARAERDKLRDTAEGMARQLAYYVEAKADNDPAVFATSGFDSLPTSHKPLQPLEQPYVTKIEHGSNSGVLLVYLTPSYRQVVRYDLRYAIEVNGILDDEWKIEIITSSQFPYTVSNLKRGAVYVFQVRALGKLGFTDWSDSFTFMCT